jgi:hypothetical protein
MNKSDAISLKNQIPFGGIKKIIEETGVNHITVSKILRDFPKCTVNTDTFIKVTDKAYQIIKEDREKIDLGAAKLAKLLNQNQH